MSTSEILQPGIIKGIYLSEGKQFKGGEVGKV